MSLLEPVPPLKMRRTKIVATLGPASNCETTLVDLVDAGADVFRLNMSHGSHAQHAETYHLARAAAAGGRRSIAILADLCGPKIRVGRLQEGAVNLEDGERVVVTTRDLVGGPGLIPCGYRSLASDVSPGSRILMDDGMLELMVESVADSEIGCQVLRGGLLRERKGINLPNVRVSAPSLTDKDRADAHFALDLGVDFLALSFVREAQDIRDLRQLISEHGSKVNIIAKIERPEALDNIDEILHETDAIMVARGDLGVELPPEEVPLIQELLINRAHQCNKPVIVATQMLESMVQHSLPTRAEVSDVSRAVRHGTDAVMLSAETAAGRYPVQAVRMMNRITRQTEAHMAAKGRYGHIGRVEDKELPLPPAIAAARAVSLLSRDLRIKAVVVLSQTGVTAAIVSATRPAAPVLAVSWEDDAVSRMNLMWGVMPRHAPAEGFEVADALARRLVLETQLAAPGEHVLLARGFRSLNEDICTPSIAVLTI
ncbi:MAG: pyruvate kinase [Gammaproteobacteria bacterium SHHR-1]|uniref:pyruvate kinase n=1 Tax=Magnetovirga frankeli TaxID=947516 RepID=UPI0012939C4B|nr:pyruvate kinase [gamma proteobacterium SS-5]